MTDVPFLSFANIAFFFIVRGLSRRSSLEIYVGCIFAAGGLFIRQIAVAIPASLLLYFLFTPSHRSWRYLLPTSGICLLFFLAPILTAQIFGVTSASKSLTTWVIDFWLHHYNQAVSGLLRIFIHTGLALLPLSMPIVASVYRRSLFWRVVAALSILTGCSMLLAGEIPNPQDGMWQLNTLGKERHLLQGPPAPDFLPLVVESSSFRTFVSFFYSNYCESYRCDPSRYWKSSWSFRLVWVHPVCPDHGSLVLWSMGL